LNLRERFQVTRQGVAARVSVVFFTIVRTMHVGQFALCFGRAVGRRGRPGGDDVQLVWRNENSATASAGLGGRASAEGVWSWSYFLTHVIRM
jgi:hypothetical protein